MPTTEELSVRKTLSVPVGVERAFELFTERIGEWWPFATHSLHGAEATSAVFEGRAGGRVYERTVDGREGEWGRVLVYEAPGRFVLEWRVSPARPPTELEVRFSPEGDGTRVELEHRGWGGDGERSSYDSGWDQVLRLFAEAAER